MPLRPPHRSTRRPGPPVRQRTHLTPVDTALAYLASFAGADPDEIAGWVADDFVNEHTAALGSGCVGREEYRRRLPRFLADFEGLRYDPEDVVADGGRVVVAYRMTATHQGHPVDLRGVFRLTISGGLVARRIDYWDALTFLRQTSPSTSRRQGAD